jgi:hypothetical protein
MSYTGDPLSDLANHLDKESLESLVNLATTAAGGMESGNVEPRGDSEDGSSASGAATNTQSGNTTLSSVEMAFSSTTVTAPPTMLASSDTSSHATESVAQ